MKTTLPHTAAPYSASLDESAAIPRTTLRWIAPLFIPCLIACSQPALSRAIYVDDYLSACNGPINDDTPCIQAAVNDASKGDTIHFSARTYYVLPGHYPEDQRYGVIFKSGLSFQGAGKGKTIITTLDDLKRRTGVSEIWYFNAPNGAHDVAFSSMTFLMKGRTNPVGEKPTNNPAIAAAKQSSNFTIRDIEFRNNPGNQTIFLNYDNSLGTNYSISDCDFINMGYGVPGNDNNLDHSSIYISGHNAYISRNHFYNSRTGNITAIEVHGSNATIENNTQLRGGSFTILASTHSDASASILNNIAIETYGIILWPSSPKHAIDSVTIYGNHLKNCYTRSCVYARPADRMPELHTISNLTITTNIFRGKSSLLNPLTGVMIGTRTRNALITNNTFIGDRRFGIDFRPPTTQRPPNKKTLNIYGNTFEDMEGEKHPTPHINTGR